MFKMLLLIGIILFILCGLYALTRAWANEDEGLTLNRWPFTFALILSVCLMIAGVVLTPTS